MTVVALVLAMLVLGLWDLQRTHGPWGLAIQSVAACTLLLRRCTPLTVLFLATLSTIGLLCVGWWAPGLLGSMMTDTRSCWILLFVPFAVYSALVYGADRRQAWIMVGITTLAAARPWEPSLESVFGVVLLVVLPAMLGNYVAGLNDRVERAEREQHRLAEQARVEERVRLAAEMHDVVTHRVSLMVLQAGALGVTATDATTRAAAEDLRAAGCQALEELRDLLGVLRSAPDAATEDLAIPRAGGEAGPPDFAELLAESESVGVSVELDRSGNPALASPVVARTAYRIVQEALTNVRKHAPGTTALVGLHFGADRVRVTVRNGRPDHDGDADLTASGSGTGLLGLRQRVELVSGALHAAPTEDGGFEVEATLPGYVPTPDRPRGTAGAPTASAGAGGGT
ncbi:MAG TPA: histidine kinase [Pseudonocardia sp.]